MKIIVEPTGCLAAAAVMNKKIDVSGARVGVIISGGNVDMEFFSRCMQSVQHFFEMSPNVPPGNRVFT